LEKILPTYRRYDLDWLRVIAFFLLILFHAGMAFVEFPWHIKNPQTSHGLTLLWAFLHGWRMPLLFLVSGAGIWYALRSRGPMGFIVERSRRLLVPLIFGVLVIVPPQVYLERLTQGATYTSYLDFYPNFFEGFYFSSSGGNFSPHHLWFIGSLFVYCMVLLPLLVFLKSPAGKIWIDRFDAILSSVAGLYSVALAFYLLNLIWAGGFFLNSGSALTILLGFLFVSSQRVWATLVELRLISLLIAGVCFPVSLWIYFALPGPIPRWQSDLVHIPAVLATIYAILGFAYTFRDYSNAFLSYVNEGVYPFYIIHQAVSVAIVYYVVPLTLNLWVKFGIVIVGTATITLFIYHFGVRPFRFVRPLFGLKLDSSR
jgi:peptidoglycan/LPS O-acetylase OafA/YrhL